MNFALPALVILLGFLPGLACFYGYFAGRFDKRTAGVGGIEEVALYIFLAIPIDAAAAWTFGALGRPLHFEVLTEVLSGTNSAGAARQIAGVLGGSYVLSATLFALTLFMGFVVGSVSRRIVWACRFDIWVRYLRMKHEWFYVLQGRLRGLQRNVIAYVDVLTHHPDGSRLYRGLVVDFELGEGGCLESLTLRHCARDKGRGDAFEWRPIPSDRLIVMGGQIHSLNITYLAIEETQPSNWGSRLRLAVRQWWWSFLREDP
ncbi:MAG: hypothetical protein QM736_15105 [Vicinamibacterales bacterium]